MAEADPRNLAGLMDLLVLLRLLTSRSDGNWTRRRSTRLPEDLSTFFMRQKDTGSSVDSTVRKRCGESNRVEVVNFAAQATNDLHSDNAHQPSVQRKLRRSSVKLIDPTTQSRAQSNRMQALAVKGSPLEWCSGLWAVNGLVLSSPHSKIR